MCIFVYIFHFIIDNSPANSRVNVVLKEKSQPLWPLLRSVYVFADARFNNAYPAIVKVKLFLCIGEMNKDTGQSRTMSSTGEIDMIQFVLIAEFSGLVLVQTVLFICSRWVLNAQLHN